MLVDSHCHLDMLDLEPHGGSLQPVLDEAKAAGVEHILSVSVELDRFPHILAQAKQHQNVTVSCGIHPNEQPGDNAGMETLLDLASDPLVVAIGETGLDTFRSEGDLEWQKDRFRHHIHVAKELGKPLIIHTREAKDDTLAILEAEGADQVGGVIHCFTEDWDMAQRSIDLGFVISFSGIVTFKNAKVIQQVAKDLPLDKILVETDAPYLTPAPNRGKPNYPKHVRDTAQFVADLREITLDELAKQSTENFYRLFAGAKAHNTI